MRKEIVAFRKLPMLIGVPFSLTTTPLKSGLPTTAAINWPRMSFTKELTMALKAAPMMTATARSTTLPRRMKSRNPLSTLSPPQASEAAYQAAAAFTNRILSIDLGIDKKKNRHGQDHQVGVKKEQDSNVIQGPASIQTAGRLKHAPEGEQSSEDLPMRRVQGIDIWKAAQAQAENERADGQNDAANQRALAQAEEGRTGTHHLSHSNPRRGRSSQRGHR